MSRGKRINLICLCVLDIFCFLMFIGAKAWGDDKDLIFWGILMVVNNINLWGILA